MTRQPRHLFCLAPVLIALTIGPPAKPQTPTTPATEPQTATEWFRRASDLFNLRLPGAASFHMKIAFHADPGIDFAKPGKSPIVTGDGTYEETWVSPERWRREVTLGSYHAVEIRANGARKLQATSDYEPSRVLMLLDALYNPIPRNLISPELIDKHMGWKIEHLTAGTMQYVRISGVSRMNVYTEMKYEYDFLPSGILVRDEESDYASAGWSSDVAFAGKVVPRHFIVGAMGRNLITADVSIEPLAAADPALFDLPGDPANPGQTLRPLRPWDVKYGKLVSSTAFGTMGDTFEGTARGVLDRNGVPQELELVTASDMAQADVFLNQFRAVRISPSTIDGSPCQVIITFITFRTHH